MFFYARIKKEGQDYLVSFPDLPNINTYGQNLKQALANAKEALDGSLETDFERGFKLPRPKRYKNYYKIPVAPHIALAYTLRQARKKESQTKLAKKLGISYQAYQRLENPRQCNPTIKTLEKIAEIMDKKVNIIFS